MSQLAGGNSILIVVVKTTWMHCVQEPAFLLHGGGLLGKTPGELGPDLKEESRGRVPSVSEDDSSVRHPPGLCLYLEISGILCPHRLLV